jgi:phosphoribosylanthranilate isomerase
MIIKVCGMRDGENIRQVSELGIDWLGLIFWPQSPRYVSMVPTHAGIIPDRAAPGSEHTGSSIKKVGVFVDDSAQNIITRVINYRLNLIQLHGHESPVLINNLRATFSDGMQKELEIIKAISISSADDLLACKQYEECVDYFLFDTKCQSKGGSGKQFDWSVLEQYSGSKPFLLSGGIGPEDSERIKAFSHPMMAGIDLNSRFETGPAQKDVAALAGFIRQLRG